MPDETPIPFPPEHLELFSRYFNGTLRPEDLTKLEALLRADPAACDLFVQIAELDGLLTERSLDTKQVFSIRDEVQLSPTEIDSLSTSLHDATVTAAIHEEDFADLEEDAVAPPAPIQLPAKTPDTLVNIRTISAAAILLLCVGLVGYFLHRPAKVSEQAKIKPPTVFLRNERPIAVFSSELNAHFAPVGVGNKVPVLGNALSTSPMFLESGLAKIDLQNGVSVIVEGPTRFTIESAGFLHLDEGRVSARVSRQGRGFTVESNSCRVTDLGTEFGVAVSPHGSNEIQVFEGQVALSSNTPEYSSRTRPAALILATGQARRVDHPGDPAAEILAQPASFVRVKDFDRWASVPASAADQLAIYYEQFARTPGLALLYVPDASNSSVLKNRAMLTLGRFDIPVVGNGAPTFVQGRAPGLAALNLEATKKQGLVLSQYPITQTGKISAVAWVKLNSYVPYASIIKSWGETKSGAFHFGLTGASHQLEIQLDGTLAGGPNMHDDQEVPLNRWVPLAFVSDGATVSLYQDGVVVASGPSRPIPADQVVRSFSIGFKTGDDGITPSPSLAAGFWDGQIGEIAIFDRALSAKEVAQLSKVGEH